MLIQFTAGMVARCLLMLGLAAATATITLMIHNHRKTSTLYCFSPPVMLATIIIEGSLALYTLWRYRLTRVSRIAVATLLFLALFQVSEFFVCTGSGSNDVLWSRIGFASISMLPPLGLHLLHALTKRKTSWLVWTAYATAVAYIVYFLSYHAAFDGQACMGNYVIFQLGQNASRLYALFYYGWIATVLYLSYVWRRQSNDAIERVSIVGLVAGYLVFLIPTGVMNTLFPDTVQGIPSIMCGFAVLFALILVFFILPQANQVRPTAMRAITDKKSARSAAPSSAKKAQR